MTDPARPELVTIFGQPVASPDHARALALDALRQADAADGGTLVRDLKRVAGDAFMRNSSAPTVEAWLDPRPRCTRCGALLDAHPYEIILATASNPRAIVHPLCDRCVEHALEAPPRIPPQNADR